MTPNSALKALRALFGTGTCPAADPALADLLTGLAHPSADGAHWVLSRRLLAMRDALADNDEAVAAVLAGDEPLWDAWLRILAARCREAGQLADPVALVLLVSRLGAAAASVEAALDGATLAPSDNTGLERALFGAAAEQARSTPALVRVAAAQARLARWRGDALPALAPVDTGGTEVDANWCPGRLLALPDALLPADDWLLHGRWQQAPADTPADAPAKPSALGVLQHWVLPNPWPLLLAMIGLVQDAWAAEGRGGLLLELPRGQNPQAPAEVQVLVALTEGDERLCGTLGGLVLAVLARLDIALFPRRPPERELNALLAPVVGALLRRRVWAFHEGLAHQQGQYRLSGDFSDACYRSAGVLALGRNARRLRGAVRTAAQQWRLDTDRRDLDDEPVRAAAGMATMRTP
jgi:hypothetical protein